MRPVMPGRLGHYSVRSGASVVGSTARWPSVFSPRGLMPMRSRMERVQPLPLPVVKPNARQAPRLTPVIPFTVLTFASEQPSC